MAIYATLNQRTQARARAQIIISADRGYGPAAADLAEALGGDRADAEFFALGGQTREPVAQLIARWREDRLVQLALSGRLGVVPSHDDTDQA